MESLQGDWLRQQTALMKASRPGIIHYTEQDHCQRLRSTCWNACRQTLFASLTPPAPSLAGKRRDREDVSADETIAIRGPLVNTTWKLKRALCILWPLSPSSSFDHLCQLIADKIQLYFGRLSKEALGYRVRDHGWIVDKTQSDKTQETLSSSIRTSRTATALAGEVTDNPDACLAFNSISRWGVQYRRHTSKSNVYPGNKAMSCKTRPH